MECSGAKVETERSVSQAVAGISVSDGVSSDQGWGSGHGVDKICWWIRSRGEEKLRLCFEFLA